MSLPDLLHKPVEEPPLWHRALWIGALIILLGIGIVGSIFPIIPGFPFLIVALVVAPIAFPQTRRWINSWDRRLSEKHRMKLRHAIRKVPIKKIRDAVQA